MQPCKTPDSLPHSENSNSSQHIVDSLNVKSHVYGAQSSEGIQRLPHWGSGEGF